MCLPRSTVRCCSTGYRVSREVGSLCRTLSPTGPTQASLRSATSCSGPGGGGERREPLLAPPWGCHLLVIHVEAVGEGRLPLLPLGGLLGRCASIGMQPVVGVVQLGEELLCSQVLDRTLDQAGHR